MPSSEHDRLEAQYEQMKARKFAKEHGELLERCKQLKWLAGNILHHGPGLPSRNHWSCLYRLAEQAEKFAKATLASCATHPRDGEGQQGSVGGMVCDYSPDFQEFLKSGLPEGSSKP